MIYDLVFCIYMVPVNYNQKNYDNFQMQLLPCSAHFSIGNTKNWQETCNTTITPCDTFTCELTLVKLSQLRVAHL